MRRFVIFFLLITIITTSCAKRYPIVTLSEGKTEYVRFSRKVIVSLNPVRIEPGFVMMSVQGMEPDKLKEGDPYNVEFSDMFIIQKINHTDKYVIIKLLKASQFWKDISTN